VAEGADERHEPGGVDPVLLAFSLWDDDCAIFAAAHGISLEAAAERLRSQREIGRTAISDGP
jgi:hypothetical protein